MANIQPLFGLAASPERVVDAKRGKKLARWGSQRGYRISRT
jgi:hypothetical protein